MLIDPNDPEAIMKHVPFLDNMKTAKDGMISGCNNKSK